MNEQNEFIKNYLHTEYVGCLKTDHEKCIDLQYEEIGNFVESGLCGTAAVISPVGKITDYGKEIVFRDSEHTMGPVTKRLYDILTGMQHCEIEAPEGWIHKIM